MYKFRKNTHYSEEYTYLYIYIYTLIHTLIRTLTPIYIHYILGIYIHTHIYIYSQFGQNHKLQTMSTVTPSLLSLVENTAETRLVSDDAQLAATLANSARHGLPPISITPLHGQHLSLLAQLVSARAVLEVGTLGGYSAQWFARAGARVTSIEVDARHRDVALENLRAAGVDGAEVVLGDALDVLPRLAAEGRVFDLVFVDADWGRQADYFDWAVRLTRRGGAIYVDNAVQSMVEDGEDGVTREGSLVARVGRDERVRAALVPTVSVRKGDCESEFVDGFLLAVVL